MTSCRICTLHQISLGRSHKGRKVTTWQNSAWNVRLWSRFSRLRLESSSGRGKKVNLSPCFNWTPRHEGVLGEQRYSSTHSLTSALDGCEWSASRPGRYILRKRSPYSETNGTVKGGTLLDQLSDYQLLKNIFFLELSRWEIFTFLQFMIIFRFLLSKLHYCIVLPKVVLEPHFVVGGMGTFTDPGDIQIPKGFFASHPQNCLYVRTLHVLGMLVVWRARPRGETSSWCQAVWPSTPHQCRARVS